MANQGPKSQTILVVGGGIAGVTAAVGVEADMIATPCPLCQTNVEMYQWAVNKKFATDFNIPVVFYSQIMAVACGMDAKKDAAPDQNIIMAKKLEEKSK